MTRELTFNLQDPDFAEYKNYLVKFEIALNRRAALSTSNKKYNNFMAEVKNDPRCFGFGIESLLQEPVSRVPRYKMLLEQLIKYTSPDSPEFSLLTRSFTKVSEMATENNEAIRARENKEKIMEIMLMIDVKSRINLLDVPERWFIKGGLLERQTRFVVIKYWNILSC